MLLNIYRYNITIFIEIYVSIKVFYLFYFRETRNIFFFKSLIKERVYKKEEKNINL